MRTTSLPPIPRIVDLAKSIGVARRPGRVNSGRAGPCAAAVVLALLAGRVAAAVAAAGPAAAPPCAGADTTPSSSNGHGAAAAILCLVNQERAKHGVAALVENRRLDTAARLQNADMIAGDYFAAVGAAGQTPKTRLADVGYLPSGQKPYFVGENIAVGFLDGASPQAIMRVWVASPSVLANLLNPNYRVTGIDVAGAAPASVSDGLAGATYTQVFSAPRRPAPRPSRPR